MRITRELLYKFARDTIKNRVRREPDLHAAYLTGSLLDEEPLLGGSTDIDLVLVHKYQIQMPREVEGLTPEVSLDISHKLKENYSQHKQLRQDPWLGYPLTRSNIMLYDTDHWLEFIQAGVKAQFHNSENTLMRATGFLSSARDNWFSLMQNNLQAHQKWVQRYLDTLELAANAIAGLVGPPLTTRRFMLDFRSYLETLDAPQMLAGFMGLLGITKVSAEEYGIWLSSLQKRLDDLVHTKKYPVRLAPCRHTYYLSAIQSLAEGKDPTLASWPFLRIWVDAHLAAEHSLPDDEVWEECLTSLDLTAEAANQKVDALDAYLDNVEVLIENWSAPPRS